MHNEEFEENIKKMMQLDSWFEKAWESNCPHIKDEGLALIDLKSFNPKLVEIDNYSHYCESFGQYHLKFSEFKFFSSDVYDELVSIGRKSIDYQKAELNLEEIAQWPNDNSKYNVNEQLLNVSSYAKDKINQKVDIKGAYQNRM